VNRAPNFYTTIHARDCVKQWEISMWVVNFGPITAH
jgi:hypothetical protein